MTYKDKQLAKKHNSLFVKIKRRRAKDQDVSELVAQLEKLKCQSREKGMTRRTKPQSVPNRGSKTPRISNYAVSEILAEIKRLAEQQKILQEQLSSGKVNSWPIIKPTRKGKKFIFYVYE